MKERNPIKLLSVAVAALALGCSEESPCPPMGCESWARVSAVPEPGESLPEGTYVVRVRADETRLVFTCLQRGKACTRTEGPWGEAFWQDDPESLEMTVSQSSDVSLPSILDVEVALDGAVPIQDSFEPKYTTVEWAVQCGIDCRQWEDEMTL